MAQKRKQSNTSTPAQAAPAQPIVGANTPTTAIVQPTAQPAPGTYAAQALNTGTQQAAAVYAPPAAPAKQAPPAKTGALYRLQIAGSYAPPAQAAAKAAAQAYKAANSLTPAQMVSGQFVTLQSVQAAHKAAGLHTASKWLVCFGGNRGLLAPVAPCYKIYWGGGQRWFSASVNSPANVAAYAQWFATGVWPTS